MKNWIIFATLGPKIYNMLSAALNGPCIATARNRLYEYKRTVGLDNSFFGEVFKANRKYIEEYCKAIGWDLNVVLRGSIAIDAVACTVKAYYTVDEKGNDCYHNCIVPFDGPHKGEHVPVSHLFMFCFVPLRAGLKRLPLFF